MNSDPDQLESVVTKVQRWTTSKNIPNYTSVIDDLSPLLDKMIAVHSIGVKVTLYYSIAISRMIKKHLTEDMAFQIRGILTFNQEELSEAFYDIAVAKTNEVKEYMDKLYNPFKNMLKNALSGMFRMEFQLSSLREFTDTNHELIGKYNAQVFVNFIAARIFYMENDYETASVYYLKAFELGRYRIGRKIKILIFELLYCCRKTDNKKLFKRIHDWQAFIIDQKEFQLFSIQEKTFDQVWKDYSHFGKFALLQNNHTGKIYT